MNKHDERCLARRNDPRYKLICTCGMTDVTVAEYECQHYINALDVWGRDVCDTANLYGVYDGPVYGLDAADNLVSQALSAYKAGVDATAVRAILELAKKRPEEPAEKEEVCYVDRATPSDDEGVRSMDQVQIYTDENPANIQQSINDFLAKHPGARLTQFTSTAAAQTLVGNSLLRREYVAVIEFSA
jgi:hypothetical protein